MFTCPSCTRPGIPTMSRFLLYLYEPLKCRACSALLFAHPLQGTTGSAVTLLFVVLALAVLALPGYWLFVVVVLYVVAKIGVTLSFPLVVGGSGHVSNESRKSEL